MDKLYFSDSTVRVPWNQNCWTQQNTSEVCIATSNSNDTLGHMHLLKLLDLLELSDSLEPLDLLDILDLLEPTRYSDSLGP